MKNKKKCIECRKIINEKEMYRSLYDRVFIHKECKDPEDEDWGLWNDDLKMWDEK